MKLNILGASIFNVLENWLISLIEDLFDYLEAKHRISVRRKRGKRTTFFQKIEVLNTRLMFFISFLSDCPKNDGNR